MLVASQVAASQTIPINWNPRLSTCKRCSNAHASKASTKLKQTRREWRVVLHIDHFGVLSDGQIDQVINVCHRGIIDGASSKRHALKNQNWITRGNPKTSSCSMINLWGKMNHPSECSRDQKIWCAIDMRNQSHCEKRSRYSVETGKPLVGIRAKSWLITYNLYLSKLMPHHLPVDVTSIECFSSAAKAPVLRPQRPTRPVAHQILQLPHLLIGQLQTADLVALRGRCRLPWDPWLVQTCSNCMDLCYSMFIIWIQKNVRCPWSSSCVLSCIWFLTMQQDIDYSTYTYIPVLIHRLQPLPHGLFSVQ